MSRLYHSYSTGDCEDYSIWLTWISYSSSQSVSPVNGNSVILEETMPIRIEMFYDWIKVISLNSFVLICSDVSFWDKWTQIMTEKFPNCITECCCFFLSFFNMDFACLPKCLHYLPICIWFYHIGFVELSEALPDWSHTLHAKEGANKSQQLTSLWLVIKRLSSTCNWDMPNLKDTPL